MRPNVNLMKATLTGALGGLLFGFDTVVIAGAIDALVRLYGLSPQEKGLTVAIGLVGTVIGALGAGAIGQRLGGRETLRITAILYVVSAVGCGLAWGWYSFMIFRFIGGLGIGASSVLGPVYIAELAPAKWRGRLVAAFQLNVVFGIMVAYTSNYFIRTLHLGATEWRWQVGIAGIPAVAFLILLFRIPRSPRFSASRNRIDEALAVLKLMGEENPEAELADIRSALAQEHAIAHEPVFRWKYRYPLFLAISIGAFNQLAGINAILYYLNNIFAAAGFSQISSDQQAIAIGATNFTFTLVGMSLIDKLGRKTLLLIGAAGCSACLGGVAWVFATQSHQSCAARDSGYVHRLLFDLAGRGHLGLYRRSLSDLGSLEGARRGLGQPLVHERGDCARVSGGGAFLPHPDAVCVFRNDDRGAVCGGASGLPGDQGADAGGAAAAAGAGGLAFVPL